MNTISFSSQPHSDASTFIGMLSKEVLNQSRDFFWLLPFDVVDSTLQPYHEHALCIWQVQNFISPALNTQSRERTTTWARIRDHRDTIAQIVPDEGLHRVRQVGQERCMRYLTCWHRSILLIDWLQYDPGAVEMESLLRTLESNIHDML